MGVRTQRPAPNSIELHPTPRLLHETTGTGAETAAPATARLLHRVREFVD